MAAGHWQENGYYVIGPLICSWAPGGFSQCGPRTLAMATYQ